MCKHGLVRACLTSDEKMKNLPRAHSCLCRNSFALYLQVYIPGKVLLFYQNWDCDTEDLVDTGDANPAKTPPSQSSSSYTCRVTDGTALALQTFEVDGFRGIGDHTTASYYQCLRHVENRLHEVDDPAGDSHRLHSVDPPSEPSC